MMAGRSFRSLSDRNVASAGTGDLSLLLTVSNTLHSYPIPHQQSARQGAVRRAHTDILTNPTMKTPEALLNAVFYVEEMATPPAADMLLN
jgi:hypothetical protein